MPRRRQNIGRRTRQSNRTANARRNETEEQRTQRNETNRRSTARNRENASDEARAARNEAEQRRIRQNRANMTDANRMQQNIDDRQRMQANAITDSATLYRAAFHYNNELNYSAHKSEVIGAMSKVCPHCKALKFVNEPQGLCCSNGKVVLPILNTPPEPLYTLVSGTTPQSKHFLKIIEI